MEIRPMGTELFHMGGRTDRPTRQNEVTSLNFAKAPKNCVFFWRVFHFFCMTVTEISDYFPTQHYTRFVHALRLVFNPLAP